MQPTDGTAPHNPNPERLKEVDPGPCPARPGPGYYWDFHFRRFHLRLFTLPRCAGRDGSSIPKVEAIPSLVAAPGGPFARPTSEFIPQRELHHAGLSEEPGVITKVARGLFKGGSTVAEASQNVETREIGNIEDFPAELEAVGLAVRHFPTLAETHVPPGEAVSA